jgi:hypothetical protein
MAEVGTLSQDDRDAIIARLGEIENERRQMEKEAKAAKEERRKNTSIPEDILKSAPYVVPKVAAGFAGTIGDFRDLAQMGREKFIDPYLPDWALKADKKMREVSSRVNPTAMLLNQWPTSEEIRRPIEKDITGPWYQPATRTGQVFDTGAQAATTFGRSLFQPATAKNAIKAAAGVTVGTEGLGAVFDDNPWARAVGGIAGGSYPAWVAATRDLPGKLVRQAIGDPSPAQISRALQMQSGGHAYGVPLMGTESFDAGHSFASAIAHHPAGEAVIAPFLAQRPSKDGQVGQVERAARSQLLDMTGPLRQPEANAATAQRAATGAIEGAEKFVRTQARPWYNMAANDQVPVADIQQIVEQAQRIAARDTTGKIAPIMNDFVSTLTRTPGVPARPGTPGTPGQFGPSPLPGGQGRGPWIPGQPATPPFAAQPPVLATDIENLDRARKYWRDQTRIPFGGADALPSEASAKITGMSMDLKQSMKTNSPAWEEARRRTQALNQQYVDPLKSGGVGTIAGSHGYDPAVASPVARIESTIAGERASPEGISTVHTVLNNQDPAAFRGMAQNYFRVNLNKSMDDIISGAPSTVGAKLANALAGNPDKKLNLEQIITGVAEGHGKTQQQVADAVKGVNNFMEVLRRTGRTPGAGSPTHTRGETRSDMGHTYLGDYLSTISLNPLLPIARRYNDVIVKQRYQRIAEALVHPDSVNMLIKMAKLKPEGVTAQYYAASILGLDKAASYTGEGN